MSPTAPFADESLLSTAAGPDCTRGVGRAHGSVGGWRLPEQAGQDSWCQAAVQLGQGRPRKGRCDFKGNANFKVLGAVLYERRPKRFHRCSLQCSASLYSQEVCRLLKTMLKDFDHAHLQLPRQYPGTFGGVSLLSCSCLGETHFQSLRMSPRR